MSKKRTDFVAGLYSDYLNPGRSSRNPNVERTQLIQGMYFRLLGELCMNRFTWNGLPDSVDKRYLEMTLYRNALSVFYYDEDFNKHFALTGSPSGRVNMMDQPTAFHVVGNGFVSKTLSAIPRVNVVDGEAVVKEAECVPIWANYFRRPDLDIVMVYANRFAELDRTIEINVKNARMPRVVFTDENSQLSAVNVNRQIDEGAELIKLTANAANLGVVPTVLDMGVHPDQFEKLHILKVRLWNECMGYLGINNANQDKKERLVAAEVGANDEQVESNKAVNLNARTQACDEINRIFNLEISVDYNSNINGMASSVYSQMIGDNPNGSSSGGSTE